MNLTNITYQGGDISDPETLSELPGNLRGLLESINGFIQFEGGLHVRGAVSDPKWHSIAEVWSGSLALSALYKSVERSDVPFAQDCVGDQYLLRDGEIWHLCSETGELENLELGLKSFFEAIAAEPIEFLGLEPLLQLQQEGARLEPGELIHAYPPFCTEEAQNGASLRAVSAAELIRFHAKFAAQLPSNGEQFRVRVE